MEAFFEGLGIGHDLFAFFVLPLLIFLARIIDVSINTIRIIFVMTGKKFISTVLGFLESLIWLLAIGQIFQHMDNVFSYIAYPLGFATGIYVGMLIEEKLALGKVVVRVITSDNLNELTNYITNKKFKYTVIEGHSVDGNEQILFAVIKRDSLPELQGKLTEFLPKAFYTIESVKSASETGLITEQPSRRGIGSWLGSVKRK